MNGEKYKVGDKLVCMPGFTREESSGGSGYASGRVFTVRSISNEGLGDDNRVIYWPKEGDPNTNGIYGRSVKLHDHVINEYPLY